MEVQLIDALIWIRGQCDGRIRHISCDGGGMLASVLFTDWMRKQRILFRVCRPMIQKQSGGVVRTAERQDTEAAHTLLEHAGAPMWLWTSAMEHAMYLSNRVRIHHANDQTVYEMRTGRKPSLAAKKIGVWGCNRAQSSTQQHTHRRHADYRTSRIPRVCLQRMHRAARFSAALLCLLAPRNLRGASSLFAVPRCHEETRSIRSNPSIPIARQVDTRLSQRSSAIISHDRVD